MIARYVKSQGEISVDIQELKSHVHSTGVLSLSLLYLAELPEYIKALCDVLYAFISF